MVTANMLKGAKIRGVVGEKIDVHTVVTWDQRNCGKSYSVEQNNTELTYELLMNDDIEIAQIKH